MTEKFVLPWKMSVCIWTYFGSDNMSYESCEQTGSYDESKLTWKLWKLAVDKPWKHRCNVWLIKMGEKTKYQWGNSRKILWIVFSIVLGAIYSPENSLWIFIEKVTSTSEVRWKTFHLNCAAVWKSWLFHCTLLTLSLQWKWKSLSPLPLKNNIKLIFVCHGTCYRANMPQGIPGHS